MRSPLPLFLLLILAATFSGCHLTRDSASRFIAPPLDTERREARESANKVLANPDLMLTHAGDYYIGPGDVLDVTLVGRKDIFGENSNGESKLSITVTQNPFITLPLIGAIKVHGKTAEQVQEEMLRAYKQFIVDPNPIVTISTFHQNQVAVLGSVKAPGRYPLDFGDTVLDLVFKAGGLNLGRETPPARYMKIYREKLSEKDKAELPLEDLLNRVSVDKVIRPREEITLPIEDLILAGNLDYNIPVEPNDILYIPPAGTVIVQGKVKSPGVIFLGPSLRTVTQVLTVCGGLTYGAASTLEVVRSLPDGTQESYFLDARRMMKRKDEDFLLKDSDQVFVFKHPYRSTLEWFGNIFKATAATGVNATYNPL